MRLFTTLSLLLAFAVGAQAVTFINFEIPGSSGSISSGGVGTTLVGTNIAVDNIRGRTAPNAFTDLACTGCVLSFTTGIQTSANADGTEVFYGNGGSFTITGTTSAASGVLLQGTFVDPQTRLNAGAVTGGFAAVVESSTIIDVINPGLATYFGQAVPANLFPVYSGTYQQTFYSATNDLRSSFTSAFLDQGLNANTSTGQFVPEPSHVLLSATAAGILAIMIRRRRAV